jgi:hypothetical protein
MLWANLILVTVFRYGTECRMFRVEEKAERPRSNCKYTNKQSQTDMR